MAESETTVDSSLLQSLKLHLEGLKRTPHGLILYKQIQRGLQNHGRADGRLEIVFVGFLHALLGKYAKDANCDPATRVKARLIQQRLTPYLPTTSAVAGDKQPPAAVKPAPPMVTPPAEEVKPAPPAEPAPAASVMRQEKIEEMEDTLAQNVTESIAVDKQFGKLLESEREALQKMENQPGDFSDLKQILVRGLNELIEERQALIEKLSGASEYMKAVEADRERLRLELSNALKHSMADELTGLPKREVFVRQLEAEIGRVKRYGFSLALAVIDIDKLESVNGRYGRDAGDAVLRCYASQILSKFRTYDLISRYDGDSFAVLFPNTQKDGAMHALEKARKTAAGTFLSHNGKNLPLPSFSSVLTQYSPGETAAALLKRADETLSQAKLGGYNRLVVALPTS